MTAIIVAAGKGNNENIQDFLAAVAKPNVQAKNDDTALLEATVHGYPNTAIMLLRAGASPLIIAVRHGKTALEYARQLQFNEITALLTQAGERQ
ncbi:MAG: hypothetical protein GC149_13485 [Gammaproteobacteria bacterium]|nr:hypothetical protein [Gammaproteobacteria bacterium]